MYGHIEKEIHRAKHLLILKEIQKETKGFTEFVPLSFVHKEAPMYKYKLINGVKAGPSGEEIVALYATSRRLIFDAGRIPAQRTTKYEIIKVFNSPVEKGLEPIEEIEWSEERFGSYFRLIKNERYKYKKW
jgi:2-iminoacetate synthase ThiH